MSANLSPYDVLVQELLLPQDIRAIVDAPFMTRGYQLTEDVAYDWNGKKLTYNICKEHKVVLLNMAGTVIAESANFPVVAGIVSLFTPNSAGLFFFANIKDLNPEYSLLLANRLKKDHANIKEARFFNQAEIDMLKAKPDDYRNILLSQLLSLDTLLPPAGNGSGPKPQSPQPLPKPLDLSEIRDRVVEILYESGYKPKNIEPREYFVSIRDDLGWPNGWSWEPASLPQNSAKQLVMFVIEKVSYPPGIMVGFTPLGRLLDRLLPQIGGKEANEVYNMIVNYRLIDKPDLLAELKQTYWIPDS